MVMELERGGEYENLLIKCLGVLKPENLFLKQVNGLLSYPVVSLLKFE